MAVKELNEIYGEVGRNLDNQMNENVLIPGETATKTFGAFKFFSGIKKFLEGSAKKIIKGGLEVDSLTVSGSARIDKVVNIPKFDIGKGTYYEAIPWESSLILRSSLGDGLTYSQIEFDSRNIFFVIKKGQEIKSEYISTISDGESVNSKTWSSAKLASKIESVINDANYFVTFPNGNYIAIGSNEVNGPNDGSGIHMYMTSLFNGCFFQICGSHGTGKLFVRNGPIGNISKSAWREI